LRPSTDRVCVTPDLAYAGIYAIGGDVYGSKSPRMTGRTAGYILEFTGDQLGDVLPDEDMVGNIIGVYLSKSGYGKQRWPEVFTDEIVSKWAHYVVTKFSPNTVRKLMDGEYSWYAKVGKHVMERLPQNDAIRFINLGKHIANAGIMMPCKMYQISLSDIPNITRDGSNLRQYLKLIKRRVTKPKHFGIQHQLPL